MDIKKINQEDLRILIRNTAQKMALHESVVEKDFWVCVVLYYLFHESSWQENITFKGGTSLSKCFSLIKRFSEDIDLILDWRVLGYGVHEPWEKRSNTQQDKFNHKINMQTEQFLAEVFSSRLLTEMKKKVNGEINVYIDRIYPQTVLFQYPQLFPSSYLSGEVRLEIGTLAAWTPSEEIAIQSYVSTIYNGIIPHEIFTVRTVSPERTFWEKATILHQEANRPLELDMPLRYARHCYDLYQIGLSKYKTTALDMPQLLEEVVAFKRKFYPRRWAKYEEATLKNIRLVPEDYRFPSLHKDYDNMQEMSFSEAPKFEKLMEILGRLEEEIHQAPE